MTLFSLPAFVVIALIVLVARATPRSRRASVVAAASVGFVVFQTGPVFGAGLAYAATTFFVVAAGAWAGRRLSRLSGADANGFLAVAIVVVIAPLVVFKIVGAFFPASIIKIMQNMGDARRLTYLAPLGISYLTFRVLAYLAEIRMHRLAPVGMGKLMGYALFWPTLMAGPIERPGRFFEQENPAPNATSSDTAVGLARIATGCIKTLVLGAAFGKIAGPLTGLETQFGTISFTHLSAGAAWICLFAYALHLYLDFSGYSDIAIGLARLMGYRIMENFRWPILATDIADFWRRWHISLTSLVTDYVYIPMGGNRKGARLAARNTMLAMVLVGLWHGFNPHFAWWGAYHGALLVIYRQWRKAIKPALLARAPALARWIGDESTPWRLAGWAVTFTLVALGWLLFFLPADLAGDVALKLFGLEGDQLDLTDFLPLTP